jgi:large subunit ribosomal protein L17
LHQDEEAVKTLFTVIAPTQKERRGGYTRIVHLGSPSWKYRAFRQGDAAEMVILEFVDVPVPQEPAPEAKAPATDKKSEPAAKPAEPKKEKEAAAVPA